MSVSSSIDQKFAAMLLCGGRSSRMGQPKMLLPWNGTSLLNHLACVLAEVCDPLIVVAAEDDPLPTLDPPVTLIRDLRAFEGPLWALADAWSSIPDQVQGVFLAGCDFPFLSADLVRRCCRGLEDVDAVVTGGRRRQPLLGAYRLTVGATMQQLVAQGHRRLLDVLHAVSTRTLLPEELAEIDPLGLCTRNINTPEEYAEALKLRAGQDPIP